MVFFTKDDYDKLNNWEYKVNNRSILSPYILPFYKKMTDKIIGHFPNVSANFITLVGFLCMFILNSIGDKINDSYFYRIFAIILILLYSTLDSIDGILSRQTKTNTTFGELFDHCLDSISLAFLIKTMNNIFLITNENYDITRISILLAETIFILTHIMALDSKIVTFQKYTGPSELLFAACSFIMIPKSYYEYVKGLFDLEYFVFVMLSLSLVCSYFVTISQMSKISSKFDYTKISAIISYLFLFGLSNIGHIRLGMAMSIVLSEIILAKILNTSPIISITSLIVSVGSFSNCMMDVGYILYFSLLASELVHIHGITIF